MNRYAPYALNPPVKYPRTPVLDTDDSVYHGVKGLRSLARVAEAELLIREYKFKDTNFAHVTRNLLVRPNVYLESVEGNPSVIEDAETRALGMGAVQDLRALDIYLKLMDEFSGFKLMESTRREGFYPAFSSSSPDSKLYIAKARRALKGQLGGNSNV